ncbi:MAG: LptA/OstA family protein [Kordiimonas sp.]
MTTGLKSLVMICSLLAATGASAQSVLKNHDTYQPIDIAAERLEMKQKQGRAIFKGSVKVTQGKMTLSAETLTVFYETQKEAKDPAISRLDALGGVSLVSSTESLSGDWGVYDVDRRIITIGGNVTFQQGDSTLKGQRLEFDLISGVAKLDGQEGAEDGRVKGSFSVPNQN